jgi:arsenate reductase
MVDDKKEKVLFLCTQNSARSQMAEALLRMMYGDKYESYSAGTNPFRVNPFAVKALELLGVDMSGHRSKGIEEFKDLEFDYVITVCDNARENCPYFPGRQVIHHSFNDPASVQGSDEGKLNEFIRVRHEIQAWLQEQFS